jgi:hypothetical protein
MEYDVEKALLCNIGISGFILLLVHIYVPHLE